MLRAKGPSLCNTPSFTAQLCHTPSSPPHVSHTQLCQTPSFVSFATPSFTRHFGTHHLSHTVTDHLSHTFFDTSSFTHTTLSYTIFHHTIFHTQLCHTHTHTIFLCHTPSFTDNFVTHNFFIFRSSTTSFVFPSPLQHLLLIIGKVDLWGCPVLSFYIPGKLFFLTLPRYLSFLALLDSFF